MNEVRKFVDNCIKTKDGIRFRKRLPIFANTKRFEEMQSLSNEKIMSSNDLLKMDKDKGEINDDKQSIRWWIMLMAAEPNVLSKLMNTKSYKNDRPKHTGSIKASLQELLATIKKQHKHSNLD